MYIEKCRAKNNNFICGAKEQNGVQNRAKDEIIYLRSGFFFINDFLYKVIRLYVDNYNRWHLTGEYVDIQAPVACPDILFTYLKMKGV